ncbi:MAG: SBBP repeat-containing protein, partial [Anaerolineales bacterium]|nr:SBBP repeat-containing protein [Anaerolineales bacterium]
NGGSYDVFMTKLNGSGSALVYATYLGGSNEELGFSFDVDASGAAYIVGRTSSLNFPITPGALDTNHNGNNDAFVVKLNGVGSALIYATYLGGSSNEGAVGVTVDASGAAFVSGSTDSTNFPTTPGAMDTSHNGNVDGFIAKLNEAGSALAYATYLGGSGDDYAGRIAIDSSGAAYVTGETASTNFPTTPGAVDTSHNGNTDAFIAKLEMKNSTTELAEKIQSLANNTNTRLNQLLAEADHIAQDGDYFAVQKKEDEVDLITDAILDSASILGDGFEAVNKVKDLTKIQFPGVVGRGWGYVLNLKADHEVARDAFLDALQREVTSANAQRAAREFFNGAHIYYAADMVDAAAEDLLGNEIKDALKLGLNSDLALQNQLYPAQQELVTLFQQDVASTRDRVIAQLPPLSPAQAQAYIDDLNYRDMANYVMLTTLERRAVPLHQAQDDRENHQDNWIANFLAKYLIKGLAYLYADGPGVLAVDIGSAYWNLYQNSRKLAQDRQMMNLAVNGMAGTLSEESRMYLNTVHGIDNITQGIQPQIANADVSWIASSSEGEYKLFGRWWWCEHSSYNDINLSNNTSYDTVYQVISSYGATGFLGTSYQSLVSEGVKAIPASGANTIRVYYKQGDEGVSPDEDSTIIMDVLGSTNTGTYYVDTKNLTWAPTRIPLSAAFQISTQDQADAPAVPYPIHTQLAVDENNLLYTPHIWVTNAFTQTALVTLTQTLPANVQVIDANGGSLIGNSLRWQTTLDPQASVEITHSVRYLGSAGQTVQYPEPQLEMTDTGFIESVTFNGEAETFISQLPLGAEGAPPAAVERGESVTIPITVTNRLNDQTTAGTVRLILIDLDTQTEVYSQSIDVSILAGATQTVDLFLDAAYVTGFNYLLIVTVESNEGQDEVFSEYLNVQQNFYLPLIRLND